MNSYLGTIEFLKQRRRGLPHEQLFQDEVKRVNEEVDGLLSQTGKELIEKQKGFEVKAGALLSRVSEYDTTGPAQEKLDSEQKLIDQLGNVEIQLQEALHTKNLENESMRQKSSNLSSQLASLKSTLDQVPSSYQGDLVKLGQCFTRRPR